MDAAYGKTVRFRLVLSLISMVFGSVIFAVREDFYKYFNILPEFLLLPASLLFFLGVGLLLMLYLKGDISVVPLDRLVSTKGSERESNRSNLDWKKADMSIRDIQINIKSLENQIENISRSKVDIGDVDKAEILDVLKSEIPAELAEEFKRKYSRELIETEYSSNVRITFQETSSRLISEIGNLSRRGNLNLVIGVLTTAIAVGLLTYMVLGVQSSLETITELLSYYIPRITTVIFIEIFSFFFLKLYKSSLMEVKYYQDELTRIAAQQIAFEAAGAVEDSKTNSIVIESIAKSTIHEKRHESPDNAMNKGDLKDLVDLLEKVGKLVTKKAKSTD